MGPVQVVDSLRGSAPAPIGWARRPPGGHTREHAGTERPPPPPAPGVSNQILQNRPIRPGRIPRRTPGPTTAAAPVRLLLVPPRRLGSSPTLLPSPRCRGRTMSCPEVGPVRSRASRYLARGIELPSRPAGCPGRTTRPRRRQRLRRIGGPRPPPRDLRAKRRRISRRTVQALAPAVDRWLRSRVETAQTQVTGWIRRRARRGGPRPKGEPGPRP